MQERVRGVSVLEQKLKAFVTCVSILAVMPVFCTLFIATRASAVSLHGIIKEVTTPATSIVLDNYPASPQPTPLSVSTYSNNSQPAPAIATNVPTSASDTTASPLQSVDYSASLEPVPMFTQDLQQINTQSRYEARLVAVHGTRTIQNSTFAFLQPSEQGWKVVGIVWYWWALAGVTGWLGARVIRRLLVRRGIQKPLVS